MQKAVAKSAYGVGDFLPLLVYALLEPDSKSCLMEFSMLIPQDGEREHHDSLEEDVYERPRGNGD